jgi:hypothetical protein
MFRELNRGEKGQAVVVLALSLLVLIGFAALAVDGSNAYAQRRAMQNAADAGALAGVRALAVEDASAAYKAAQEYVLDHNAGGQVEVTVAGQEVTVIARKSFSTFFARAVNVFSLDAGARAAARYGAPTELRDAYFFPVLIRDDDFIRGQEYEIWDDKKEYPDAPENVIVGANRGWANFDGGEVAKSDIKDWCRDGWFGSIAMGDWINGSPGTAASGVEMTAMQRIGDTVIIPIYDDVRPAEDGSGSGQTDFHVARFASFTITEVHPEDTPKRIIGVFSLMYVIAPVGTQQHIGLVAIQLIE